MEIHQGRSSQESEALERLAGKINLISPSTFLSSRKKCVSRKEQQRQRRDLVTFNVEPFPFRLHDRLFEFGAGRPSRLPAPLPLQHRCKPLRDVCPSGATPFCSQKTCAFFICPEKTYANVGSPHRSQNYWEACVRELFISAGINNSVRAVMWIIIKRVCGSLTSSCAAGRSSKSRIRTRRLMQPLRPPQLRTK